MTLNPKEALGLTSTFHELAINAMTHGALLNGPGGRVNVTWRVAAVPDGPRIRLSWRETGGPPVAPDAVEGFGRRLIEGGLARDLNGEVGLGFEVSGVTCQIVMPVPRQPEDRDMG